MGNLHTAVIESLMNSPLSIEWNLKLAIQVSS
jgi:hypothetical protein